MLNAFCTFIKTQIILSTIVSQSIIKYIFIFLEFEFEFEF